jgi:hypothetical protein
MAVIVSLREVIEQMALTSDEPTAYINRNTGEVITLTHEEVPLAEDPEEAEDPPQCRILTDLGLATFAMCNFMARQESTWLDLLFG